MMKLSLATLMAVSLVATGMPALAQGQRIQPKDGDVVMIEDGARVKIIRRSNATVSPHSVRCTANGTSA